MSPLSVHLAWVKLAISSPKTSTGPKTSTASKATICKGKPRRRARALCQQKKAASKERVGLGLSCGGSSETAGRRPASFHPHPKMWDPLFPELPHQFHSGEQKACSAPATHEKHAGAFGAEGPLLSFHPHLIHRAGPQQHQKQELKYLPSTVPEV